MRAVFMGTPKFSVPSLQRLYQSHDVTAVITRTDKPTGRNLKLTQSPVKEFAMSKELRVIQPKSLKENKELEDELRAIAPDVVVVVAYGLMIPKWLIDLPPLGCVNVHGSLLPEYRGAAPIQRAIIDGKNTTGLTTILIDEGMDTGDILLKVEVRIEDKDNNGTLFKKMEQAGADLLMETLEALEAGSILPVPQDDSKATAADMIDKGEMKIDWTKGAAAIDRLIRALSPKPGAYTFLNGKRVKILEARPVEVDGEGPGGIIESGKDLVAATGSGGLLIESLQPEGKRVMRGDEFIMGHQQKDGSSFQ